MNRRPTEPGHTVTAHNVAHHPAPSIAEILGDPTANELTTNTIYHEARDTLNGDGAMRDDITAEAITHDNGRRAHAALEALQRHGEITATATREAITDALADLLGDLQHLADALNADFEDLLRRGTAHHNAELTGN